ncbi:hypothetical protein CEXT_616891 [Caerostris extrusa]|uniref:Uncharacterized protein n=1 Tax=Caerostris extrusa TaxID=172846 RepID=A0AAV4RPX1_CAEEX|nr:hypothetical protein CEXT_616891 [Caerostris extrusa]
MPRRKQGHSKESGEYPSLRSNTLPSARRYRLISVYYLLGVGVFCGRDHDVIEESLPHTSSTCFFPPSPPLTLTRVSPAVIVPAGRTSPLSSV